MKNTDMSNITNTNNTSKHIKPYGAWPSSVNAEDVAKGSSKITEPCTSKDFVFWLQSRPEEDGRMALYSQRINKETKTTINKNPDSNNQSLDQALSRCILPVPYNIRSKVHEYGGGSYCINNSTLYFVNAIDQQIYMCQLSDDKTVSPKSIICSKPKKITDTPHIRYGDIHFDPVNRIIFCVAESHSKDSEPENYIAAIVPQTIESIESLNHHNDNQEKPHTVFKVIHGHDFYAYPKPSPCGKYLAYIIWNHPDLPWDNTELEIALINIDSLITQTKLNVKSASSKVMTSSFDQKHILQEKNTSVVQPRWSPTSDLFYISDKNNWWNLYRISVENIWSKPPTKEDIQHLVTLEAEFATPLWTLGMSCYDFINENEIIACYTQYGLWYLAHIQFDKKQSHLTTIQTAYSYFSDIHTTNDTQIDTKNAKKTISFICASPHISNTVGYITEDLLVLNNKVNLRLVEEKPLDIDNTSIGESLSIQYNEKTTYAFFYPPKNKEFDDKNENKPPLIAICHGGPTGQSDNSLNPKIQFWTNRGFAVVDVNYRGSTGYGRQFRQELYLKWGISDIQDMCAVASHLAKENKVNNQQKIIKGSSAGGFTVLACLTFTDTFDAGVSLYGIGDLELLATDTHKFESRYLDQLIGMYPTNKNEYEQRSPINHVDKLNCPLLLFQGLEDKVVPPNQAQNMAKALLNKNVPVALVEYPDEGHGFRNPKNIKHMMEAELYFYQQVFNLASRNHTKAPITIENFKR